MESTVTEATVKEAGGGGSETDGPHSRSYNANGGIDGVIDEEKEKNKTMSDYFGWVYHLGTNSIGHEYCHLRFLFIRGKYVEMYKRDPHENPGIVSTSPLCFLLQL